jgi:serine/threonine protein phosphatase PrpC
MASDFAIKSDKATDRGRKRSNNEDYVDLFEPADADELLHSGRLYVVADGVGGAAKGEKASQYATQTVLFEFYGDPNPDVGARLKRAMRKAGNDIYEHAERNEIPARMATTMVAANVRSGVLTVANVGDSRAYLIRGGRAQQISRDHTIAGEMLRDGEIDEEEALRVKGKNRLMRSLGGERDVQVDIFPDIPLQPGDHVLLCSDGLARYTVSDDIAKLASEGTPTEIAQRCINYANHQGGVDNISVVVIEVGEPLTGPVASIAGATAAPKPVDWDEMVTVPSVKPIARRKHRIVRARFTKGQKVVLGIAGVVVTLIFVMAIRSLVFPYTTGSKNTEQTITPAVLASVEATASNTSQPGQLPIVVTPTFKVPLTSTDRPKEISTISSKATETLNPVIETTVAQSPLPTLLVVDPVRWDRSLGKCLYTAESGDTAETIVKRFGLPKDLSEYYSSPEKVLVFKKNQNAVGSDIQPSDEIVLLFITEPAQCHQ